MAERVAKGALSPRISPAGDTMDPRGNSNRIAKAVIVGGARTPFVRAFEQLAEVDTIGLGVAAVRGALVRTGIDPEHVDAVMWGGVVLPPSSPNVGREIVLDAGFPRTVDAMTVSRACASGLAAITTAVAAIERGEVDVVIAGGSDSLSNVPVTMPPSFVRKFGPFWRSRATSVPEILRLLGDVSIRGDLLPELPRIAERTTGLLMGEAAEDMAERNAIARLAQDEFAVRSHHRAAAAIRSGRFDREVVPVTTPSGDVVASDGLVRADTTVDKLSKLPAAFRKHGTLTAGNSSSLTDGAAAVVVMNEHKARALGLRGLAYFRSWKYVAVDPADQLLMGPAIAMPAALERAGLTLAEVDYVDMHEAFAAQVLSVVQMLASDAFARARLGRTTAVGAVDPARLNLHGGSIALGHPFAATGARMVLTMANELAGQGGGTALLGLCAAGGLGAAAVLEAAT